MKILLEFGFASFSPLSFNGKKLLEWEFPFFSVVVVITRALIKTSAREGFYGGFVWKFRFQ